MRWLERPAPRRPDARLRGGSSRRASRSGRLWGGPWAWAPTSANRSGPPKESPTGPETTRPGGSSGTPPETRRPGADRPWPLPEEERDPVHPAIRADGDQVAGEQEETRVQVELDVRPHSREHQRVWVVIVASKGPAHLDGHGDGSQGHQGGPGQDPSHRAGGDQDVGEPHGPVVPS